MPSSRWQLRCASRGGVGASKPIVIGEINPRTGVLAVRGTAVHQGISLAVKEVNARGGIVGRPLTLL